MRFAACVILAAALASTAAGAQENKPVDPATMSPMDRFQAFVTSEGYKQMVGQLATMGETVSAPECKEIKPRERMDLSLFQAPNFGTGENPIGGIWRDRIKMDRCGTPSYQNILIQGHPDGTLPPRAALLMPGLTAANPPMQSMVMKDVLAQLEKKKCADQSQIVPVSTAQDKESVKRKVDDKGMLVAGTWTENWVFNACGKKVTANVEFKADGKGALTHKIKL